MDPSLSASLGILPGTTINLDPSSAYPFAGSTGEAAGTGTGQHGVAPSLSSNGGGMGNGILSVWDWLNQPFQSPMSIVDVMLMVGVVIVSILLWNLILYHVRIAAETI